MALQIKRESVPNGNYMRFHVTTEICRTRIASFERPLRKTSTKYLDEVGEKGANLVRKVTAISGVTQVFTKPYEFDVIKAELFSWDDIAPVVEKSIRVIFGGEGEEEAEYLSVAEIPLVAILIEPFKRLGWAIRKAWYRILNLAR